MQYYHGTDKLFRYFDIDKAVQNNYKQCPYVTHKAFRIKEIT